MNAPVGHDKKSTIKSFVLRQGRLTNGQKNAFEQSWGQYGCSLPMVSDCIDTMFPEQRPVTLEIGFGNGESLAQMVQQSPDKNHIGIEVHKPGVGHLLMALNTFQPDNIKIFREDAVEVIKQLPDNSLSAVHIYFPDPWHKKKHHKRRLIQDVFLALLIRKMTTNAVIHVATDWRDYAEQVIDLFEQKEYLHNISQMNFTRPDYRPETKFERRGIARGHRIFDIIFKLI
jgi:tRNA (guanine-N7-)-methyltransferase